MGRPVSEKPNISEMGGPGPDGQRQSLDRRVFMQLLAFTDCHDIEPIIAVLNENNINGALYEDINDPRGIGIVTFSEDPAYFVKTVRPALLSEPFNYLTPRPEFTMLGRTYSIGYEPDLEERLITTPKQRVINPDWPWAIWYPLRRSGQFQRLDKDEQNKILMEHGVIGKSFGDADYAYDIRLACHGLDKDDSDFIIGILGKELYPLSAIVQTMRGTIQTSLYLERLGPFFVGHKIWASKYNEND